MIKDTKIQDEIYSYIEGKASVLFFILSLDGEIVSANQYAKEFTGHPLMNEYFQDIIVDFQEKFSLAGAVKEPYVEQMINVSSASGLPQDFYFTFKQSNDHILVFGRLDAEDLGTMKKEILSLNQELNNLMRELHQKNSQLKRLNEEKNRFLGMAAHDLRKPIGLVLAYSEFLIEEAETVLTEEHIRFLNTIKGASFFMKRLVDDFLDVSAIEAGKFELDLQIASIQNVLSHCLELNTLQANKKGIEIRVQCEKGLPHVAMDASKIEQAITNLVSNAIEHTELETVVNITLTYSGQSIIFSVQDSGPGIAPDDMDRLFKPFEKTSSKKTAGEKSTGLGMLITRKVIEAHHGKIWIDSKVGEGTIVYFNIPIQKGNNETGN